MIAKKQSKKKKDELPEDKIVYPTAEEVKAINTYIVSGQGGDKLTPKLKQSIDKMNANLTPRDPKRIPEILDALKALWEKYPDQRLGQLLGNYVFTQGERGDKTSPMLFYQEDDVTLKALQAKNIPRGRANDSIQDLYEDGFLGSEGWKTLRTKKRKTQLSPNSFLNV